MHSLSRSSRRRALALALALALAAPAAAAAARAPFVKNGGFERGRFAAWGHRSPASSGGDVFVLAGRVPPLSRTFGWHIPAPPQGRFQAVIDQSGPGSNVLFHRIRVAGDHLALRLTFWYRNRAGIFFAPRTLDFDDETVPNQQLRIDLMRRRSRIRTLRPRAILATPFRTVPGSPVRLGPTRIEVDLSRFAGRTIRLRVAEVDTATWFHVGVDNVRLVSAAGAGRPLPLRSEPAPAAAAPAGAGPESSYTR